MRNFEPHLSLIGGRSGVETCARLIPGVPPLLFAGGWLLAEAGAGQAEQIREIAEKAGLPAGSDFEGFAGDAPMPGCAEDPPGN